MRKQTALWIILTALAVGLTALVMMPSPQERVQVITETVTETVTEYVEVEKVVTIVKEPTPETELTEADKVLMAKVVHAEAGNQDMIGRRLVAAVILNRCDNPKFPNQVPQVVAQANQFAVSDMYVPADMMAVELECKQRIDHDVLWFRTNHYHTVGIPLYQHGAHYFSGEVIE